MFWIFILAFLLSGTLITAEDYEVGVNNSARVPCGDTEEASSIYIEWKFQSGIVATLNKSGSLNVPNTIYWGGRVNITSVTKGDLVIKEALVSDSGSYTCERTFGTGIPEDFNRKLYVYLQPETDDVQLQPPPGVIVEGEAAFYSCVVTEVKPSQNLSFIWSFRGDKQNDTGEEISCDEYNVCAKRSQFMPDAWSREDHETDITCLTNFNTDNIATLSDTISVQYPPGNTTLNPSDTKIDVLKHLTLTCKNGDVGNPRFDKTLYFLNGSVVEETEGDSITFTITDISYSGEYTCQSTNELEAPGETSAPSEIIAYVPGEVKQYDVIYEAGPIYGDPNPVLTCLVYGVPAVSDVIIKAPPGLQGSNFSFDTRGVSGEFEFGVTAGIQHNTSFAWSITESTRCSDVVRFDGEYECRAVNLDTDGRNRTSVECRTSVSARYQPLLQNDEVANVTAYVGKKNVGVPCDICGNPTPTYVWYFQNEIVQNSTDDTFVIREVQTEHFGDYVCVADNALGRPVNFTVSLLDINGPPPEPPTGVNVGAIVGGTVGIAVLSLVIIGAVLVIRRQQSSKPSSSTPNDETAIYAPVQKKGKAKNPKTVQENSSNDFSTYAEAPAVPGKHFLDEGGHENPDASQYENARMHGTAAAAILPTGVYEEMDIKKGKQKKTKKKPAPKTTPTAPSGDEPAGAVYAEVVKTRKTPPTNGTGEASRDTPETSRTFNKDGLIYVTPDFVQFSGDAAQTKKPKPKPKPKPTYEPTEYAHIDFARSQQQGNHEYSN